MMSTRALGLGPSLRKAAFSPKILRNSLVLRNAVQRRSIQTVKMPESKTMEILNRQRLRRPSSPHFTIYQPQLTWLGSIFNRVTGAALGVVLYGFSIGYLFAPESFSSAHVIETVAGLPDAIKYFGKFALALPATFHTFNGIRHLVWDTGKWLSLEGCYRSGYAVLAATGISTLALVFYY
ncbi:putative succinate dehydrogenase/Fumarate reductase transmembrane subunit [Lyophyllum shimeji]|uniref:Succinate dehydrogenase/Fumarate reductase transmembrane subunit n=1 Tax=Lyophyllum shimeji TaxID=47721 RepID=A0A9P3UU21_LYOSH|nr:putative succinate dehydrogenase/Fumarate reductase transmembrane subunit [Lyophyllum shimeji]